MASVSLPYRLRRSFRLGDELLLVLVVGLAAGLFLLWKQRPPPSVEGVWTDAHGLPVPDGRKGRPLVLQTRSASCPDQTHPVAFEFAWPIDAHDETLRATRTFRLTNNLGSDALPADARDTGLHRDGHHLWVSGSQDRERLLVKTRGQLQELVPWNDQLC